jgi:hypothetical protein
VLFATSQMSHLAIAKTNKPHVIPTASNRTSRHSKRFPYMVDCSHSKQIPKSRTATPPMRFAAKRCVARQHIATVIAKATRWPEECNTPVDPMNCFTFKGTRDTAATHISHAMVSGGTVQSCGPVATTFGDRGANMPRRFDFTSHL